MSLAQQENKIASAPASKYIDEPIARETALSRFCAAISGLENVLDYETSMLENYQNPDYADINARKTRGLRDLNNSMGEVAKYMNKEVENKVSLLLGALQKKLERNSQLLQIHLEAVSELTEIIQESARAKETDGTYFPCLTDNGACK